MSLPLMPAIISEPTLTPTASFVDISATNQGGTYTVPSPTSANRFIVYVTSNQGGAVSLTSCTIAGVNASVANSGNASFACALVPTGTSITISTVYAFGGGTGSGDISAVYVAYDLESPVWRSVGFNAGNPASATVLVPEKGLVFAPVQVDNDNQSVSFAAGMVRDANGNNGPSRGYASAHRNASTFSQYFTSTAVVGTTNGVGCYMGVGVLR